MTEYRRKRDFRSTAEPEGTATGAGGAALRFVVQKHAARRLHYDFRLELDGVLKSWAVTRGPSPDPADKRLAVHVEDHPLDYGKFEGVIPAGQYGGGTVMLWDRGTWEPEGDPRKGYDEGKLKFRLKGRRLKGGWTLVRMGGRAKAEKRDNWLLIKEKDRAARPGEGDAAYQSFERSVASRRTMDGIAKAGDRVWKGADRDRETRPAAMPPRKPGRRRSDELSDFVAPQLATLVEAAPRGEAWLHEIKLDGYRLLCRIEEGKVRLLSRNGQDWTRRFPAIAEAARRLETHAAMLDGEAVALLEDGRPSFGALQRSLEEERGGEIVFFAFDLLHLDGEDLRREPLENRKQRLEALLGGSRGPIRYLDHQAGSGAPFLAAACEMALEGVVSKRRDRPYTSGRNRNWQKSKCVERQEFAIVGFTHPKGGGKGVGALALALRGKGGFRYVGRVGTGFDAAAAAALRDRLEAIVVRDRPVEDVPALQRRGVHWVEPRLVAEVEYRAWTDQGRLRHASYVGLREDKDAGQVTGETAQPAEPASRSGGSGKNVRIAGVRLSNPAKVLWPRQGVTKLALAEYWQRVEPAILAHAARRPLTLVRCPEGRKRSCFYQKHATDGLPEALRRVAIAEKAGKADYLYATNLAGFVALAQMGVLEVHLWGAKVDRPERPDRVILDLDPDEGLGWERVVTAALSVRDRLEALGLESFVKTTGGKGLHVTVPILRRYGWDAVRDFAKGIATQLAKEEPERYTATMAKSARRGRIFIDWLRNARGSTAVAPYSPRAREGATVATPVSWGELEMGVEPAGFTVETVPGRLAQTGDPWSGIGRVRQGLPRRR
ncbi:DNA ligase D [Geminicoccaceae bacterium 1502E]|nr:DNA ligase D [Geminicoccaceae bacterium 1502E]